MNARPLFGILFAIALPAQQAVVRLHTTTPPPGTTYDGTGPLAVRVEILHPADLDDAASTAPIPIGAPDRPWAEAVTLAAAGPDGKPLAWAFERSATPQPGPFVLRRGAPAKLGFLLAADDRRVTPAGPVELRATLAGPPAVVSAPLQLPIAVAAPASGPLGVRLLGGEALGPGDPWVFAVDLGAPVVGAIEDALRGALHADGCHADAYRFEWRDPTGRVAEFPCAVVAAPPTTPSSQSLAESGFGPVLAVLSPATTAPFAPGQWRVTVWWRADERGAQRRGELDFVVRGVDESGALAERPTARLAALLGHATALCWHGEFGNAAHVDRRAGEAAAVLRDALQLARESYVERRDAAAASALAQVHVLLGEFDAARAFARLAAGFGAGAIDARPLLAEIERTAAQAPGRLLPRLRAALSTTDAAMGAATPAGPNASPTDGLQWAAAARASSEYRATDYSAKQVIGAPDVAAHGDNARAWAPKTKDAGEEWLEVTFARAVFATGVRVVQSCHPGAVVRIEAIDADGRATGLWQGPDATAYTKGRIGVLDATFARTAVPVQRIRIVLDTKRSADWREIDAVALLGEDR